MSEANRNLHTLHVALVAPPFARVPPEGYGGTERVVADLARALLSAGHRVTLFATGDSRVHGCEHRWIFPHAVWPPEPVAEWTHAVSAARELATLRPDVVHTHTPALVPLQPVLGAPLVVTIHHAASAPHERLYRACGAATYVCISGRQAELLDGAFVRPPAVVHHGLHPGDCPAGPGGGGYALFLGRLDEVKGPHVALRAARRAGLPLWIAGKPHDGDYFQRVLGPELARGGGELIGELSGARKLRALGEAEVLLAPPQWEEPFGLAPVEAMMCGTPVVATRRGALPEIVDEGLTGFLVGVAEEMAVRIPDARRLSRARVREQAALRFGAGRMARDYVGVYLRAMDAPSEE